MGDLISAQNIASIDSSGQNTNGLKPHIKQDSLMLNIEEGKVEQVENLRCLRFYDAQSEVI